MESKRKPYDETMAFKKMEEEFTVVGSFDDIIVGWGMGEFGWRGYPGSCFELNKFSSIVLYTEEEMEKVYQEILKTSKDQAVIDAYEHTIKDEAAFMQTEEYKKLFE